MIPPPAEEVTWDMAPQGYKKCISKDLKEDSETWLKKSDHTIGSMCVIGGPTVVTPSSFCPKAVLSCSKQIAPKHTVKE